MKLSHKLLILTVISVSLCDFGTLKAATDSEGYPIVYLRGTFGHQHWMPDEAYRFSRNGLTYTLNIDRSNPVPEGEFKIADENWNFDFGGRDNDVYITESTSVTLKARGANLHTSGISDGVISFNYTNGDECVVNFEFKGGSSPGNAFSGTLPVFYINVFTDENHSALNNEVIDYNLSHKDYFQYAEYWLDINDCEWLQDLGAKSVGSDEEPLSLQIKARGNWTRIGFSKKPFKIKLDKKQDLLALTPEKSKHYALLAHADDTKGYLRNFISFNLGERIGLPWTPGMQPVELVINGDYRGLYFLTESIRVGDGRVEIEELDDNVSDAELVSGGYIVELDNYDEENQIRLEEKACVEGHNLDRLRITWDTPEVYSELQKRFITDQFTSINNSIGANSDKTWEYIDLDDAARYYLVREITGDTESFHGSTYLFRDRGEGEKWHFSPLWDAGNALRGHTDAFFYDCDPYGNTWIPSLRANRKFNDKVKDTWLWFMQNEYSGIEADIKEYVDHISDAAFSDYKRWSNEYVPEGGQPVADNRNMEPIMNDAISQLSGKINWLKKYFGDYNSGNHSEPERDDTPAAALPDYAKAGIEDIFDNSEEPVEFYNLQGLKILNPKRGEIYILKKGSVSKKIIF